MVYDALQLMAQKEIGALVVIDDGNMVGLVSERDYARKVILQGAHHVTRQWPKLCPRRYYT